MLTAIFLAALSLMETIWSPSVVPPKGSMATYTIRARQDAVFDLHETRAAEAQEAKQAYVPIYTKDNELLFEYRNKVLKDALSLPLGHWPWPLARPGGFLDAGPDAVEPVLWLDAGPPDILPSDGRDDALAGAGDAGVVASEQLATEQLKELEALIRGCFRLLIPYYQDGVAEDNEFPKEKQNIRVFSRGRYVIRPVSSLHRFSTLQSMLGQSASQFFFKTDKKVRERVIHFILQRLPPNLTYAKENANFIKDISQVTGMKVVLIHRGEVLVRRGNVIDTRAYYAIRASVGASSGTSRAAVFAGRTGLMVALFVLLVVAARETCGLAFQSVKSFLVIYLGMVLIALGGELMLVYLPFHAAAIPQAALALIIAVVLGRAPGLITAVAVPCALILSQVFDLSTLLVGISGGVTGAMAVRKRRRRSALAAGILVGVVQAVVFEACRAVEGRPRTYQELEAAGAAFGGGLICGMVALAVLPFVEWFLGRSSRGKLKVLTDFDHPLVRQLRERAPGTFAHTVTLINMVELATDAVGGDRLLGRAGTLFHDLGKMEHPHFFIENQGQGPNIHDQLTAEESARAILAHVTDGLRLAMQHGLPPDVTAFISEHHGTTGVDVFLEKAREAGQDVDPSAFTYPGPKPRSIESAILMLADSVEAASKTLSDPSEEALYKLVDSIVLKKFSELQFDECDVTQADLKKIRAAFVTYLKGALHRRIDLPTASFD